MAIRTLIRPAERSGRRDVRSISPPHERPSWGKPAAFLAYPVYLEPPVDLDDLGSLVLAAPVVPRFLGRAGFQLGPNAALGGPGPAGGDQLGLPKLDLKGEVSERGVREEPPLGFGRLVLVLAIGVAPLDSDFPRSLDAEQSV